MQVYAAFVLTTFIWETGPGVGDTAYQFEGHQIVEAGEQLQVISKSSDWEFAISGYQLTLP